MDFGELQEKGTNGKMQREQFGKSGLDKWKEVKINASVCVILTCERKMVIGSLKVYCCFSG